MNTKYRKIVEIACEQTNKEFEDFLHVEIGEMIKNKEINQLYSSFEDYFREQIIHYIDVIDKECLIAALFEVRNNYKCIFFKKSITPEEMYFHGLSVKVITLLLSVTVGLKVHDEKIINEVELIEENLVKAMVLARNYLNTLIGLNLLKMKDLSRDNFISFVKDELECPFTKFMESAMNISELDYDIHTYCFKNMDIKKHTKNLSIDELSIRNMLKQVINGELMVSKTVNDSLWIKITNSSRNGTQTLLQSCIFEEKKIKGDKAAIILKRYDITNIKNWDSPENDMLFSYNDC